MAVVNQWGKRLSTDAPIAEPDAQRRRLDEPASSSHSSSENPSVKSREMPVSPFEELPGEVVQHLLGKTDDRTQGALACSSKMFAHNVQQARWDQAGSLIDNGELRLSEPLDDKVRSLRRLEAKVSVAPPPSLQSQLTLTVRKKAFASDREIGFWLGCHYPHIFLTNTATPQLLAGLSTASYWRSLSLRIDLNRDDLTTLLEPLVDGLGANSSTPPRELYLEIDGYWAQSSLGAVPDALWSRHLTLVGLCFERFNPTQKTLFQFERGVALRYLSVVSDDDQPSAELMASIGSLFPALQIFNLRSNETHMTLDQQRLSDFHRSHPLLQTFSLHVESQPEEFRIEFSTLSIRRFDLLISDFIDPNGRFSECLKNNKVLEELTLQVNQLTVNEGVDFQCFTKAIAANKSLCKLSVKGISQALFEVDEYRGGYSELHHRLVQLVEAVSENSHINELYLSLDLADIAGSEHVSKTQTLTAFAKLESAKPGLLLIMDDTKLGLGITENSIEISIPSNEFVERFGWTYAEQAPGPEDCVMFQVQMPTWGNGAFGQLIAYEEVGYYDRQEYILDSLANGSLSKENIRVLSVVPATGGQ